jgi:uncharacterized protein (DUF1810 family)
VFELTRFRTAQADPLSGFEAALREVRAGRKRGHWIWYIFPQVAGLGQSAMSVRYGLNGAAEAAAYLNDPELRARLLAVTEAVVDRLRDGVPVTQVMGSEIDALKLVSSMTLFVNVAAQVLDRVDDPAAADLRALKRAGETILTIAGKEGMSPCAFTVATLRGNGELNR